jgi:hypothetical protein
MTYRQLDSNGDFTFGSGLANYLIDSPDAVAQAVSTRLKLWSGEWFLDVTEGTPFLSGILGKHTSGTADQLIKMRILETPHVIEITDYQSNYDGNTRQLIINVTISTDFGSADVRGVF